ncbi:hypothetical protein QFZ24_005625 [Streptomyces phaeochromogenes]|jgi:hypothetical protein|uniref:hypothetical protein n=1 Tax=Streptomyces TaxID=1883 RepID=UPI00117C539E|nr:MULTISPECIES: hypothetical protein [Streptomyces]MDQ0951702.1 hypothetical protein [Streptomyces phaeochromogenes]TRO56871.1 hypothetical protein E4K73_44695 [Streptomyces sp. IB201691-2A2]
MRILCGLGAAVVVAVASPAATAAATVAAAPEAVAPEADLAYHGHLSMTGGRVDLRMTPQNHGPSGVVEATVRLRWSVPLADEQGLPAGCARTEVRTVMCRTGALPADGWGETITMAVRLRGAPSEVSLGIDTVWGGGAVDRNHHNDRQEVLVLDTGDTYVF